MLTLALLTASGAPGGSMGYLGETLTHPGAYGQLEWTYPAGERTRWLLGTTAGGWLHPRNHLGLLARAESGVRWAPGTTSLDVRVGLGYLHTFAPASTLNYTNLGRPALSPSVGVGLWTPPIGDLQLTTQLHIFLQYPVNTRWVPRASLQVGIGRRGRP